MKGKNNAYCKYGKIAHMFHLVVRPHGLDVSCILIVIGNKQLQLVISTQTHLNGFLRAKIMNGLDPNE